MFSAHFQDHVLQRLYVAAPGDELGDDLPLGENVFTKAYDEVGTPHGPTGCLRARNEPQAT